MGQHKGSYTSTTPVGSVRKGKLEHKKDVPMLMAMHNVAYAATISPAYTKDFVSKLVKASSIKKALSIFISLRPVNGMEIPLRTQLA